MAKLLSKKFIGNDEIDGDKILLEQGQSIKAKDALGVEQDLIKLGPADEVLVGPLEVEVAVKGDSVQKTGDVMTGELSVNSDGPSFTARRSDPGSQPQYAQISSGDITIRESVSSSSKYSVMSPNYFEVADPTAVTGNYIAMYDGKITLQNWDTNLPVLPVNPEDVAVKQYVDAADAILQDQIDTISGGGSGSLSALQSELDATQAGAGLEVSGAYVAPAVSNYLAAASSLKDADSKLDTAVKEVSDKATSLVSLSGMPAGSVNLGTFTGTFIPDNSTVKSALQTLESVTEQLNTVGLNHINATVDAHDATAISFSPAGNIAATQVQAAIEELDSEKVKKSGDTMSGLLDITAAGAIAIEANNIVIGEPWGAGYSVISVKDGSADEIYVQSADQLDAFAGNPSKQAVLSSGYTQGANSGQVQIVSGTAAVSGNSGAVTLISGAAAGGISGFALVKSGNGLSSSPVQMISGDASLGNSGNILLRTGTAAGTRGIVNINAPEMSFQSLGKISNLINGSAPQDAVTKTQLDGVSSALQGELDDTQVGAGLNTDGTYIVPSISNYLNASSSLANADFLLDAQIKSAKDDIGTLVSEDLTFLKLDGSRPMEANLDMMEGLVHHRIVGLGNPVDSRDAVNKQYVDAIAEGLHVHAPAKALIAEPISGVVTYDNGSSGVGATLTLGTSLSSVDGYTLQNGDRIIVNGQADQAHNGIYTWATGGTVLTRALDFDTTTEAAGGDFIFVQEGTQFASSGWVMSETTSAIGTSPIVFVQFSGAGTYSAGDALSLTGGEFNVLYDDASIGVNGSNQLFVKTNGIASAMIQADAVDKSKIAADVAGIGLEQSIADGSLEVKLDGASLSKSASGIKSNIIWSKKYFDLNSVDITNGFVELDAGVIAEEGSIIGFVDRLAIHEDEDFIVSIESGRTRITFAGDLAAPGQSQLDANDNLYFKFQKKAV